MMQLKVKELGPRTKIILGILKSLEIKFQKMFYLEQLRSVGCKAQFRLSLFFLFS
jgi:hypothetical protein